MEILINVKYYHFRQVHSGGEIIEIPDKGIGEHVIIEALDADHANTIAEKIGLYFDGSDSYGIDCECCGDRWSKVSEDEGYDDITVICTKLINAINVFQQVCYIHYLKGGFVKYEPPKN